MQHTAPTFESGPRPLLGVHEVAKILNVGETWVYKVFALEVPPARIANKLRWEPRQIDAYIERQRVGKQR